MKGKTIDRQGLDGDFAGGDEFIAGIKDAVTEGATERFMCLGCDESGAPEDLFEALK